MIDASVLQNITDALDRRIHDLEVRENPIAAAIANASLGFDVQRFSQITNGGLEIWQFGNGPFVAGSPCADRWNVYAPAGTTSVSKDTANVDVGSGACAAVTTTAPASIGNGIYQIIDCTIDNPQLRGRTISVSARVSTSQANNVRIYLVGDKGATLPTTNVSSYHPGSGGYGTLRVTFTLGVSATGMTVWILGAVAGTWYVDNVMMSFGSVAADFVPLHPALDLLEVQRYHQRYDSSSNGNVVFGTGLTYSTINGIYLIPMLAPMGGTPTITFSAANTFVCTGPGFAQIVCTAIAIYAPTRDHISVNPTFVGGTVDRSSMLMANSTASAWIDLQWNP